MKPVIIISIPAGIAIPSAVKKELKERCWTGNPVLLRPMTEEESRLRGREFFHVHAPAMWETIVISDILAKWRTVSLRQLQQVRDDKVVIESMKKMLEDAHSRGDSKEAAKLQMELERFKTTARCVSLILFDSTCSLPPGVGNSTVRRVRENY
jgi:hypothetical protein